MPGPLDDYVSALLERRKNAPSSEGDREFYLTEIKLLKEKLISAELKVESLTAQTTELASNLGTQKVDQADIFEYLNGELSKKTDEIVRLEETVQTLEDENTNIMTEYEGKLSAREDEAREDRETMEKQITELTQRLEALNEFQVRKDELERDNAEVKATLEDEKREHQRHISELERKHVQEKDRLKKEMLVKLRETKATLHKMTVNQLDTTTKRTIAENEQITAELAWQSRETEKLVRKNEKLATENRSMKRELELHKQTEDEFARKVHVYQKTIKTLLAKLNSMDLAKRSEVEQLTHTEEEVERARAVAQAQIDALESETRRLRGEKGYADSELEQLRVELQQARELNAQREMLADEGVRFLLRCVRDLQASRTGADGTRPEAARVSADIGPDTAEAAPFGDGGDGGDGGATAEGSPAEAGGVSASSSELLAMPFEELSADERETMLRQLVGQLQAYQRQVNDLSLHKEWRQIQRQAFEQARDGGVPPAVPLPPIGMPPSAVANGATLPDGEVAPGVPMLMPDPFAFGPGLATLSGKAPPVASAARQLGLRGSSSAIEPGVTGQVRPWGKRSQELPLSSRRVQASSSMI